MMGGSAIVLLGQDAAQELTCLDNHSATVVGTNSEAQQSPVSQGHQVVSGRTGI